MKFARIKIYTIVVILLPLVPLLEGFLIDPIYSPKIEVDAKTVTFVQLIVLISFLAMNFSANGGIILRRNKLIETILAIVLFGILLSIPDQLNTFSMVVSCLLSYFIVSSKLNVPSIVLAERFIIALAILSISIMLVRLQSYGFDFSRARSGANIYGANAVVNLYLLFLACFFISKGYSKRDWLHITLAMVIAFIFVSKTGILLMVAMTLLYILAAKEISRFFKLGILMGFGLALILFSFSSLGEATLLRFTGGKFEQAGLLGVLQHHWDVQMNLQRGVLWRSALEMIEQSPIIGWGIGGYSVVGQQSSAHNLLLNNYVELGLVFGTVINLIYLYPLYALSSKRWRGRRVLLAGAAYFFFLIQAVFAGQKLVQPTGYISTFFLLMSFFFFKLMSDWRRNAQ